MANKDWSMYRSRPLGGTCPSSRKPTAQHNYDEKGVQFKKGQREIRYECTYCHDVFVSRDDVPR
jgi:hypothetical protein